ncbi:MAG TPA: methyltransferase domain-containing protein [Burkholderiales bacterium]|nr:methyltransferase domain-containing protein [Burkholderiales bacterium]
MFAIGNAYEQYMGRWSRRLAAPYAEFAAVKDGERLLDVGTGTGALAAALAARTKTSEIVGIDPSAGFIEAAKASGSPRVRFEAGDAQALPYPDAGFDRVLSLLALNFVPDHEKAVREMRRVTRPGGAVSACVWDYGEGMESLRLFWDAAVELDPAAAPKHERNMKLCRKGELGGLWRRSALAEVREAALVIDQAFSSFDDYWGPFLSGTGPGGAYVVSLDDARRKQLEARLRTRLGNDAFTLKARAWCVHGLVP